MPTSINIADKETLDKTKIQTDNILAVAEEALSITKGKTRSRVFSTTSDMQTWLSNPDNKGICKVGDNLYIIDVGVPDWWIGEVLTTADSTTGYYYKIYKLETGKVDLTSIEEELDRAVYIGDN